MKYDIIINNDMWINNVIIIIWIIMIIINNKI